MRLLFVVLIAAAAGVGAAQAQSGNPPLLISCTARRPATAAGRAAAGAIGRDTHPNAELRRAAQHQHLNAALFVVADDLSAALRRKPARSRGEAQVLQEAASDLELAFAQRIRIGLLKEIRMP